MNPNAADTNAAAAQSASGTVPDLAQSLVSALRDPGLTLGGTARLPETNLQGAPCTTSE
jgi:hypothetical protein